jgi:hypothetical protein
MSFEDVDEKPYLVVNNRKEAIEVGSILNKAIEKPLLSGGLV